MAKTQLVQSATETSQVQSVLVVEIDQNLSGRWIADIEALALRKRYLVYSCDFLARIVHQATCPRNDQQETSGVGTARFLLRNNRTTGSRDSIGSLVKVVRVHVVFSGPATFMVSRWESLGGD